LTGLLDRRGFDAALGLEYRSAAELGTPLAVIMIDVDHFRSYNEAYGHAAGDACLQAIARIIGRQLRQSRDRAARYGGEEFAAILPATDEGHAMMVADAIRRAVERQTLVEGLNGPATRLGIMPCGVFAAGIVTAGITTAGTVTVSMGVAALVAGCDEGGPARLVELAAAALCEAKRRGRNVTQAASPLLR
jgi:diguanylate cyclase (GGDEF)-like protein